LEYWIITGAAAIFCFFTGFFLSRKFSVLKNENSHKDFEAKIASLHLQLEHSENLREQIKENFNKQTIQFEKNFQEKYQEIKNERDYFQQERESLKIRFAELQNEYKHLDKKAAEQKNELESFHEKFKSEFENLTQKIFDQSSEKLTQTNKKNIENILLPLQEKIKDFEEKVEKSRETSIKRHAELGKQLEQLNQQHLKISEEAINLTRALKGESKTQGNWGEMILERVLELSGLQKDREYFVQKTLFNQDKKRQQPDVVIALPEQRRLIIDSKVSLVAYERYINTDDKEEKKRFLQQHLLSLRTHIDSLSQKNYHQLYQIQSPDFVLLFIPIDSAFALAAQQSPRLYHEAFEKQIIIVTPTTLLAVLKTIDSIWQNQKQQQNALEIATRAGRLYDTFVNLISDFERVGTQLNTVQNSYKVALRKLTGNRNMIKQIQKLKDLGAKAEKSIDAELLQQGKE